MTQSIQKILFPLLALFFIGATAFTSLDTFREYQSEVSIIVLPRGNSTAADQIVENIAFLPTTIDFFDALLASDDRLTEFSTLDEGSVSIRKKTWENMLRIKHQKGSGIITYTVNADTQEEASILSRQMVKTLFEKVGIYYDIRSEVSMRLVEGPFVRTAITSPLWWIGTSLFIGILLALVVTSIVIKIEGLFFSRHSGRSSGKSYHQKVDDAHSLPIHPTTFVPRKPSVLFSESSEAKAREEKWNQVLAEQEIAKPIIEPILQNPRPAIRTVENTAAAPANLPVMDEAEFLAKFSQDKSAETENETATENSLPISTSEETPLSAEHSLPAEPTVEDYRRRLNELLKMGK